MQRGRNGTAPAAPQSVGRLASEIEERPIEWIIPGHFARGKLAEIIGDPGSGKTNVVTDLAARITKGQNFPTGEIAAGPVSILSAEDDPEDILVPRLRAGGAKLELVRLLPAALKTSNGMQPITFPAHVSLLDESIRTDGTVALFIDPLTAFLSERVDSHNDASSRRVLAELAALAQRTHCAIISIRHLNKLGGIDRALYRASGSVAFIAAARTSFLVAFDPGDKMPESERRRVLACIKSNIGPKPQSRAFRLVAEAGEVTHIEWLSETSPLSADDLLRRPGERKPEALQEAISFLENSLADGARPSTEIEGRAHELGISEATLRRAKTILGVRSRKKGFAGIWHLDITKETAN